MDYIGIGEEEPVSFGLASALEDGVIFANPAGGKRDSLQQAQLGIRCLQRLNDFASGVGGLVVDDEYFRDFRLLGQRFNALVDSGLFVARRNDCRNGGLNLVSDIHHD